MMYPSLLSHLRASVTLSLTLAPILALSLVLSACASDQIAPTPTLSDLPPVTIPVEPTPVPRVSLDQIEDGYRAALEVATDPQLRQQILARLADMEMARSEDRQFTNPDQKRFFDEAISLYQQLIASREAMALPSSKGAGEEVPMAGNDRLLYQLSKAYALDGRLEESNRALEKLAREYPHSEYKAEADFRRAEQAFSAGDYKRAEQLYDRVMRVGQTPFYSNSIYMHGWSLFKQRRYRPALDSFALVLDDLMVAGIPLEQLAESRQNLVADTLRVMSLSLSYLDGVDTIAELYDGAQYREFQYLIYRELGDLYREKKRFRDSADTYLRYTELFPQSDYAPELSVHAIDVFEEGNFPSLVLPAKEKYVREYGINSRYWALRGIIRQEPLLPHLHQYLNELARYYHAEAQKQQTAGITSNEARQDFLRAADYYRQFINVFPMDESLPSMTFLMAEAYYEGGALVEALMAYEQVATEFQDPEHGAEAGYSAILTLQRLVDASVASADERVKWQDHKIQSALEFATLYASDSRAPAVLAQAAEELYALGDPQQALAVATQVTEWQPLPEKKLLRTAWLVRAHSLFDLELHTAAEQAYWQTLKLVPANNPDRPAIVERIAATLYRQAEQQIAAGDTPGAIDKLLQIREVAPNSEIARKGQYDAANHLMDLRQWERAEKVLVDFRKRYPKAPVADTLLPKLAVVYQSMNAWEKAADTFSAMVENEKNPDLQRQSLYLAAELYEKAGNEARAIVHYRRYAHTYAQPFDLATEARYRLVTLYGQTNEPLKRNYWLKKLIDAHRQAKDSFGSNERAHYLAAFASRELANVNYYAFKNIKLNQPIARNLQRKKKAMEKALASYQQVLSYGVAEFTTEANNRIGMIYTQLSADLMASERPEGLNALEFEQYELLLEEQAYPFEEKAIEVHAANAQRSWGGVYDYWVKQSFEVLAKLLPARYGKQEDYAEVSHGIY